MKSINDYIKFFGAIPASKWTVGTLFNNAGQKCAEGHLEDHSLIMNLRRILFPIARKFAPVTYEDSAVHFINDKDSPLGKTPRTRILAALKLAKKEEKRESVI